MGIDGEGHALLTDGEAKGADGVDPQPCVLHLYKGLVAQIDLKFVLGTERELAAGREACVAYLETAGSKVGLVLELSAKDTVYLREFLGAGQPYVNE